MMDSILAEAQRRLLAADYKGCSAILRRAEPSQIPEEQAERRRLLAWALLAQGETKDAYELFWRCAQKEGARAGILLLTVLAGQVETAMTNWQRHCEKLKHPPLALPDDIWHTPAVVRPAIHILQNYPFVKGSQMQGAAAVYQALLFQTQADAPGTFTALGEVTDFYAPARLLRDMWMDDLLCLPLPKREADAKAGPRLAAVPSASQAFPQKVASDAVASATQILLYPDLETLDKQCRQALDENRFTDALEILRRLLYLDPQHTQSLERRWRVLIKLKEYNAAKEDLFYLTDLYEKERQIVACQKAAKTTVELFPDDERALLKMCFLQARLEAPTHLAFYGRKLLNLCQREGWLERGNSYRRWLLRQRLSLDDRSEFEVS